MHRALRASLTALFFFAAHDASADPPAEQPPDGPPPIAQPGQLPAQGSDPQNGEAPGAMPPAKRPEFSPTVKPNNPADKLPGDVVFPRLSKAPVRPIVWKPEWARFKTADWVLTGAALAVGIAGEVIPPGKKHVVQTFGVDDSVRDALRFSTSEGRYVARDASDVLLSLEATWPLFIDATLTAWWYHGSPDAAREMALIDGEALSFTIAVQAMTSSLVSRERPYGQTCGSASDRDGPPNETQDCQGNSRYRSFFSGHTAFSFASAGLVCAHHEKLKLYGGGFTDHLACAIALTGATAAGTFRIVGDMHYFTDVAAGAVVGALFGVGIPLLHYRQVNKAPDKTGFQFEFMPVGQGFGIGGSF